jgi:hypothetical protein
MPGHLKPEADKGYASGKADRLWFDSVKAAENREKSERDYS